MTDDSVKKGMSYVFASVFISDILPFPNFLSVLLFVR